MQGLRGSIVRDDCNFVKELCKGPVSGWYEWNLGFSGLVWECLGVVFTDT